MKNVKLFYIYIYIVPALLSLILISFGGTLLGDFRSFSYDMKASDFLLTLIQVLIPLIILYLLLKLANNIAITKEKGKLFEGFILILFVFIFFITFFFGAIKIGEENVGGLAGLLMSLVVKLNPYLLLGLLAFSNIKTKSFVLCLAICIFYCFKQVSLQGYLISLFSLITFLLIRGKIGNKLFFTMLIMPFLLYSVLFEVLTYIYTLRNEMRGVEFDASQIMSLAVGRVSSLSSYIYIRESIYSYTSVSDFFSLGIFLERVLGVGFLDTVSPSAIFNNAELGEANYSIFLGLNGFLLSLYKSSVFIFHFNIIIILICFCLMFQMIPFFDRKNRVAMFFFIMYMPFLSFDIWEFSIIFQSLILLNLLYFFYRLSVFCFSYIFYPHHSKS
ncbi:oligosaccharide repeat unit polymerase [Pseudoalteromonas sp. SG45-1]|uniref:oligosaccharide repeat unit polymerase n=1 Tax=Pseudoalteromonas sp. SG45-1 TaxID=2760957 RepID=UPI001603DDE7|nr:oligosaccharide repeat unit polymerase [Pseudoalteromonas sp. SG45-1]MBB1400982.1 oligosaccharide repeat unit polymerase [Pseudoalteromonas sp. SG45-1]